MTTESDSGALHRVVTELGFTIVEGDQEYVEFSYRDLPGYAYLKPGAARVRGSVILSELHAPNADEALAWIDSQEQPAGGQLEVARLMTGTVLRMLFERKPGRVVADDCLGDEVTAYAAAWKERRAVDTVALSMSVDHPNPVALAPQNAWLMLGDSASYPDDPEHAEARELGDAGIFEKLWTCGKQTVEGDLLLFYFIAPHKAIHFVARAASAAFFTRDIEVSAEGQVRPEQWWCYTTPLIEIEPISHAELQRAANGFLPMRGRSGRYLGPETIAALTFRAKDPMDTDEIEHVVSTPVGHANLPHPSEVDLTTWASIASGALRLEADVERYLVEPLLDMCVPGKSGARWQKSYRIGRRVADYVVLRDRPTCVVEVKLAVRRPIGPWSESTDFQQATGYAASLRCASLLIDANQIMLIEPDALEPRRVILRSEISDEDLRAISDHLMRSG